MSRGRFLERWSRLKREAAAATPAKPATTAPATPSAAPAEAEGAGLPELASLTPDSDFSVFLKNEVSEALRRQALKTLFSDPRLNVIDRLDVYIDDYTVSEPIPPEMLAGLKQLQALTGAAPAAGEDAAKRAASGDGEAPAPVAAQDNSSQVGQIDSTVINSEPDASSI